MVKALVFLVIYIGIVILKRTLIKWGKAQIKIKLAKLNQIYNTIIHSTMQTELLCYVGHHIYILFIFCQNKNHLLPIQY